MKTGPMIKIVLIGVGILVLVQLLFYSMVQSVNLSNAGREGERLRQEIAELTVEKESLQKRLASLQKQYGRVVSSVPKRILDGYEDHEQMLAGFLDYVRAADADGLDARVSFKGEQKYIVRPVPVFEHAMTFDFSFQNLSDGGKFLALILGQDYYPLVVHSFDLHKSGQHDIGGTMEASLLIPARQQKPLAGIRGEEK